jgi:hypothetical protein
MCRFRSLGLLVWYAPHAHTDGDPWAARGEVRGVVAASERAPAALGVGGRGAAAGPWWRARGRAGGRGQRDDRPQGRVRVGGRPGAPPARSRPPARWGPQAGRPARPCARPSPIGAGRAGRARRSDVAAAVDDQVAAALGRGADPAGPSGLGPDGGPTVEGGRVQPAGQRQDPRRRPAPRPGCPVPLPQPAGQGPPGRG